MFTRLRALSALLSRSNGLVESWTPCLCSELLNVNNSEQRRGFATTSERIPPPPPAASPWTPTRHLKKRKIYKKRMRFLMQTLEEEQLTAMQQARNYPSFAVGDVLEVTMIIPENQRREYTFRGVCVAKFDRGWRSAFKIYNVYPGVGGFVQHLPLWMPDMLKLRVVGRVAAPLQDGNLLHLLETESTEFAFQEAVSSAQATPGST